MDDADADDGHKSMQLKSATDKVIEPDLLSKIEMFCLRIMAIWSVVNITHY